MEVLRIKNEKYDRNFQLTNCLFQLSFFLFMLNKQVKAEVRKQPFKCVPKEKIKQGKSLKNNCEKVIFFGKILGCRPANLRKVNSFTDILQGFC